MLPRDLANFGLPSGYVSRLHPSFDEHEQLDAQPFVWQPEVYQLAMLMAKAMRARTIIDIGCGHGCKLRQAAGDLEVIGVDTALNVAWCRKNLDFGEWIAADLEHCDEHLIPADRLTSAVIVCADVIEHLVDPLPLLNSLNSWLMRCPLAVLSTPDRVLNRGEAHLGPPPNPKHVREWKIEEFKAFLSSFGFKSWVGLTRDNTKSNIYRTIVAFITGSP
jgi:SAM-dependent methyltransferase